jgi:hypothetical protein
MSYEKQYARAHLGPSRPTEDRELRAELAVQLEREREKKATPEQLAALRRVFERAHGCSGGERRLRKFLLAWYNAGDHGGWDLSDLWSFSREWRDDLLLIVHMIADGPCGWYPGHYGYDADIEALAALEAP